SGSRSVAQRLARPTPIRRLIRSFWVWCWPERPGRRCPTTLPTNSGNDLARRPTHRGSLTPPGRKSPLLTSMPCSAIGARLGLMLAHQGTWAGKTIVPQRWLAASTEEPVETDSALLRYGYQVWLSAD